ncbi:hypothetical protein ABE288_22445 [Bacillus salipaludis]|uniref:YqgU-like beta propeller domain-containing protein n=1 Tax=Bacillus salipaludis TaxID=2547811 RepID=UPI003D1A2B16
MVHFGIQKAVRYIFPIILFLSLLLGACNLQTQKKSNQTPPKKNGTTFSIKDWKLPLTVSKGEFFKIAGWISENKILYITNIEQSSNIYIYDFLTGKSKFVFKTDSPIVNVQISPSKKYFLVQSSPSTHEGLIEIINQEGKVSWKHSMSSYELEFEWNPYDESKILISNFNEDWTFKLFLIEMNHSKMKEISVPQPFLQWVNRDQIAYLKWDEKKSTLSAPLVFKGLEDGKERRVFSGVFHFTLFPDLLLTIEANKVNKTNSTYTFFDKKLKPIFSFSIPQLTNYSDWVVPNYDYIENKKEFIAFSPLESAEADSYTEGFNLVIYNLKEVNHQLILSGLDNAPLSCSPLGNACLYGNSFEKLIDIKNKKIYDLLKE